MGQLGRILLSGSSGSQDEQCAAPEGGDGYGELMDEIERDLQLHVTPANWPVGMGSSFRGCYDLLAQELLLFREAEIH